MNIIKRDGRVVDFNEWKIAVAVKKAFVQVDGKETESGEKIAKDIASYVRFLNKDKAVEEVQDIVEERLMEVRPDVAKAYILYRHERTREREKNTKIIKAVMQRNRGMNIQNSNANVDENSFSGKEKEATSDIQKIIALDYVMSRDVSDAHKDGLIYQHDLDKFNIGEHNCLFLDFGKLFTKGFSTKNGTVRPPNSFATACQLMAVAFQVQSQVQYGGCGTVHIDFDLAPFVVKSFIKHLNIGIEWVENIKDCKVEVKSVVDQEVKSKYPRAYEYAMTQLKAEMLQACESLYHNLNTLESRAGSQVPFTSINLGRDTSPEGKMVSEYLMRASLNGIGKHHLTSIFPISIFQYKKGVNAHPGDENYDIKQWVLKSMAKRIYPNWANCDWSQAHEDEDNPDTYFATMGKRKLAHIKPCELLA